MRVPDPPYPILLNALFGAALLVVPFVYGATGAAIISEIVCGLLLIVLSVWGGSVRNRYSTWKGMIVM